MATEVTEANIECLRCNNVVDQMDIFHSLKCTHFICRNCFMSIYKDRALDVQIKCYKHNCMAMLTQEDFAEQAKRMVKKELHKREIVLSVYNKTRNDFPEGSEGDALYDDYLEEIEDMIVVLQNTSTTMQEETLRVQKKLKAEKRNTLNELGHRKEEREEQMQWFEKIAKMHDAEYTKYLPTRYMGNDIYPANENCMAQDDEADQNKLKELFSTFELNEWGKAGLEIGNKEEAEANQPGADATNMMQGMHYQCDIHTIQVNERLPEPWNPWKDKAFDHTKHVNTQIQVGGQQAIRHCLQLSDESV